MKAMYVMGIDAGTQSIKVLVYDSVAHKKVALAKAPLTLISKSDGTREQKASGQGDRTGSAFVLSHR